MIMAKAKTTSKIAMVQPKPASPEQTAMKGAEVTLEYVLELLGNNRPYTILRRHGNSWRIHFYGDPAPCTVKWQDRKPVITYD
jgi:hypothetical protein